MQRNFPWCSPGAIGLLVLLFCLLRLDVGVSWAEQAVAYRLKWLINMSTVGDVYAKEKGLFAARGLAVDLRAGGPERDAIRELELGHAHFGVASADQVIHALAKGSPVVVLAQLFQANPLQWIYFKDRVRIDALADLKGKTIGVTFGKNDEIIMRTLLARADIGDRDVRLYSVRLDYTPFFSGRADLWPVYINSQGVEIGQRLTAAGESIGFFEPEAHGVRFVANSVVTSERLLAEQPELVERFMSALLAGWRGALDPANAAEAVALVRRYDQDTASEVLQAQLTATRPLVQPMDGPPVGHIDIEAWQQTEAMMRRYGQIDRPVNVAERLRR
ncbi:ABC transporter substrate-binding protein [Desulfatitalea alkaliphila]|uniref:Thiamine pyrimidine synthase n=1 Tax=Desulfatitalea alkaliphila TaxID=2929485 RepID=A0AA41R715_9BACT|nr:ABC transporter substrate-binding protein [Desulfatitalea alkaliphila]MCJ8502405.1 ABC transporter substrate-binding protein [Desulfatitalea alkaliphila]